MRNRVAILPALLLLISLLLSACGGETPTNTPAPVPTSTAAPVEPTATTAAPPTATTAPVEPTATTAAPTATTAPAEPTATTAAAAPTATTASTGGGSVSGDPLLIGIAVAQTSNVALFGQEQVIGAKLAETYINANGGINGRPLKLVLQDTGGDEQGAINAFNALISQDKVHGIVGPTLSQQAFAADPIADRAKVPVIGPSNTAVGIPDIGDYIARISAPVNKVAPNAVDAALKINPAIKKVAILFAQNDAFSTSETKVFQQVVTDKGLETTSVQTFQTTDTDFTTQTTNVLTQAPDLVIISGLATDSGNLVKQLRQLGYAGTIVGGNGLNSPNMFPVCQQYCDGIILAQAYNPQLDSPANSAFRTAYKDQNGKEPGQFSAQAYSAVLVFAEALRALDKATPTSGMALEAIRDGLNKQVLAGSYSTPLGPITFTPTGDVNQGQFYVAQIKMNADGTTGTFEFLK